MIAAAYANIKCEFVDTKASDAKKPELVVRNPNGKLPILDTPNGPVYESNAILRYFARNA